MGEWSLTVQLGDGSNRKTTTESLRFSDREAALAQLQPLSRHQLIKANQIYTIENEKGEEISFLGARYISHSLIEWEETDLPF